MNEKELERNLKALANKRRLAIIRFIKKEKEVSVGDIASEIKISIKATSKHLSILASADILEKEQRSSQVFYYMSQNLSEGARRIISLL